MSIQFITKINCECASKSPLIESIKNYIEKGEIDSQLNENVITKIDSSIDYLLNGSKVMKCTRNLKDFICLYMDTKNINHIMCKDCCFLCKNQTNNCAFHCCETCHFYLNILNEFNFPINKKKFTVKQNTDITKKLRNISVNYSHKFAITTGYLHSFYDLIYFIILYFDYNEFSIDPLSENSIAALVAKVNGKFCS